MGSEKARSVKKTNVFGTQVLPLFLWIILLSSVVQAQAPRGYQYDESQVPKVELADPLTLINGQNVAQDKALWSARRAEIHQLFREKAFGQIRKDVEVRHVVRHLSSKSVFDGEAIRHLVTLELRCQNRLLPLHLLSYQPTAKVKSPVLLGMNFYGNQSVILDREIPLAEGWVNRNPSIGIEAYTATEATRGRRSERWPIREIVARGYGVCTLYYGDVDPDFDDGFKNGAHGLLQQREGWSSVAAWAWGLSQVRRYLAEQTWVDRVGVFGHSRLGKAALWAGAQDTGFGLVISNDSGCGGSALSKRKFGETLKAINTRFPHWFLPEFHAFNDREQDLPFDQHLLMATVAPRHLYVASASEDLWADPKGELLSTEFASTAFLELGGQVGYHLRPGRHNMLFYDWTRILNFADQYWR